jgi:hypothetical protein
MDDSPPRNVLVGDESHGAADLPTAYADLPSEVSELTTDRIGMANTASRTS